jgi:Protein of unknown function (DUF2845)
MHLRQLLLLIGALAMAEPALAFRCGSRIVKEGDPLVKVLKYCGDPAATQQRVILRSGVPWHHGGRVIVEGNGSRIESSRGELAVHRYSTVEVVVDEWTYNLGPHKLMRMVRFENGLVSEVTTLGYGYLD